MFGLKEQQQQQQLMIFFFFFLRDEWPFSQRVTRADRSRSPRLLPNLVRSLEAGVEAAGLARSLK